MADLKNPRLIYLKGFLFLFGTILACVLILAERPDWRTAVLLVLAIWCSARFYYFAFYVIQHYVDDQFRFSGVGSFVKYLFRNTPTQSKCEQPESK